MKVAFQALLTLTIAAGFSTVLAGKGATSRITISGGNLAGSVEIQDPAIVKPFQIWAGPGTRPCAGDRSNCVEGTEGFIIDWSAGTLPARPNGLQRYEISFFVMDERVPGPPHYRRLRERSEAHCGSADEDGRALRDNPGGRSRSGTHQR
jgi:hypothetical protein